jgi:hypothetical protein
MKLLRLVAALACLSFLRTGSAALFLKTDTGMLYEQEPGQYLHTRCPATLLQHRICKIPVDLQRASSPAYPE